MKADAFAYILIACGKKDTEIVKRLLCALKSVTSGDIIILAANNDEFDRERTIRVETPDGYSDAQARLWIKTRIPDFINDDRSYAYIDHHVFPVTGNPDLLFDHFIPPFVFASHPLSAGKASFESIQCTCSLYPAHMIYQAVRLSRMMKVIFPYGNNIPPGIDSQRTDLEKLFSDIRKAPWSHIPDIVRSVKVKYFSGERYFRFDKAHTYDKKDRCWRNGAGEILMFDFSYYCKKLSAVSEFRYNKRKGKWTDDRKREIFLYYSCSELANAIRSRFGVKITDPEWLLWNSSIFMFNREASQFFKHWSRYADTIIHDSLWRSPDRASLAAAVWALGYENRSTLNENLVFVCDKNNPDHCYKPGYGYYRDSEQYFPDPLFVSVENGYGDAEWPVWKSLENIMEK